MLSDFFKISSSISKSERVIEWTQDIKKKKIKKTPPKGDLGACRGVSHTCNGNHPFFLFLLLIGYWQRLFSPAIFPSSIMQDNRHETTVVIVCPLLLLQYIMWTNFYETSRLYSYTNSYTNWCTQKRDQ